MLRPAFYKRLKERYGDVRIACEDTEMKATYRQARFRDGLGLNIDEEGEYYRITCPFCTDTRLRLWFNHRWGIYDYKTKSRNLWLCICYNENCLKEPGRSLLLYRDIFSDFPEFDPVSSGVMPDDTPAIPEWPGRVIPLNRLAPTELARRYMEERHYNVDVLSNRLQVCYCLEAKEGFGLAQHRIIIPTFKDGELLGWQARLVGEPHNKRIPKYWNMPRMKRNRMLYNFDYAKRYPYVVLMEGCTDVWRFGPEAVALFGKTLSLQQLQMITATWKKVYVALDGDAIIDAQGIYDQLPNIEKYLVEFPGKTDPGSLPSSTLRDMILRTARKR
jgi:hypothetical protein